MRTRVGTIAAPKSDHGSRFWLLGRSEAVTGPFSDIGSVWVAVLLYRDGLSDRAFWALVGVASATTISMLYLDFGIGAPGEAKGYASAGASHYFVGFPFSVS